jgi:hypothetical protein
MSNAAIMIVLITSMVALVAGLLVLLGYYGIHQSKKHEVRLLRYRRHVLRTKGRRAADRAVR